MFFLSLRPVYFPLFYDSKLVMNKDKRCHLEYSEWAPLCHSKLHNRNYTHVQAATTLPIIWDYVKCLPCNGRSPFAPSPSNRQCSYNLYGQLPNRKPTIPLLPIQGCSKMVQRVSGFSQFLQPLYCCLLVPERSRRILAIQSLPSPRTVVFHTEVNTFGSRNIFTTHQKHFSFIGKEPA